MMLKFIIYFNTQNIYISFRNNQIIIPNFFDFLSGYLNTKLIFFNFPKNFYDFAFCNNLPVPISFLIGSSSYSFSFSLIFFIYYITIDFENFYLPLLGLFNPKLNELLNPFGLVLSIELLIFFLDSPSWEHAFLIITVLMSIFYNVVWIYSNCVQTI